MRHGALAALALFLASACSATFSGSSKKESGGAPAPGPAEAAAPSPGEPEETHASNPPTRPDLEGLDNDFNLYLETRGGSFERGDVPTTLRFTGGPSVIGLATLGHVPVGHDFDYSARIFLHPSTETFSHAGLVFGYAPETPNRGENAGMYLAVLERAVGETCKLSLMSKQLDGAWSVLETAPYASCASGVVVTIKLDRAKQEVVVALDDGAVSVKHAAPDLKELAGELGVRCGYSLDFPGAPHYEGLDLKIK